MLFSSFSGNEALIELPSEQLYRKIICEDHFDDTDLRIPDGKRVRTIKKNVVPRAWREVFVSKQLEVNKPSKTYTANKKTQKQPANFKKHRSINIDRPVITKLRKTRNVITTLFQQILRSFEESYSSKKAFLEIQSLEKLGFPLSEEGEEIKKIGDGILTIQNWIGEVFLNVFTKPAKENK